MDKNCLLSAQGFGSFSVSAWGKYVQGRGKTFPPKAETAAYGGDLLRAAKQGFAPPSSTHPPQRRKSDDDGKHSQRECLPTPGGPRPRGATEVTCKQLTIVLSAAIKNDDKGLSVRSAAKGFPSGKPPQTAAAVCGAPPSAELLPPPTALAFIAALPSCTIGSGDTKLASESIASAVSECEA